MTDAFHKLCLYVYTALKSHELSSPITHSQIQPVKIEPVRYTFVYGACKCTSAPLERYLLLVCRSTDCADLERTGMHTVCTCHLTERSLVMCVKNGNTTTEQINHIPFRQWRQMQHCAVRSSRNETRWHSQQDQETTQPNI